jgi:hypothetical protein
MKPLAELRKELSETEKKLDSDTLYFNALHKRAKYLKKKLVEDRKLIEELEKLIALKR